MRRRAPLTVRSRRPGHEAAARGPSCDRNRQATLVGRQEAGVHLRCSDSAQGRGKLTQCCALRPSMDAGCGSTSRNRLRGGGEGRERVREGKREREGVLERDREGGREGERDREGERERVVVRGRRYPRCAHVCCADHAAHMCAALTMRSGSRPFSFVHPQ
jgi:hypothetical protein